MEQYLTIWDLVLTPFYLGVLIFLAIRFRNKHYPPGHPLRDFFLLGLYLKFAGAIFIGLVYQFYYGGGDTFNFFFHSKVINSAFNESISDWFDLIRHRPVEENPRLFQYTSAMYWYGESSTYTVSVIGAVLGLLCGTAYMPIALLFAVLSYSGIWAMYLTFAGLYPKMVKPLAYAFLFVPSTFVWGSAIFKDTVCMFGLGWMTYCTFRIFVNKDFSLKNFLLLMLGFSMIAILKIYIIVAFMPALGLWLLMNYSKKIRIPALRWVINLGFIGVVTGAFFFITQKFAAELSEYSLDNIAQKAKQTQDWISYISESQDGSTYNLGEVDGTLPNMIAKFPQAVNVTLFRPYLWESRKAITLLSSLESTALLVITVIILFRLGFLTTVSAIIKDPNLLFCFIFTLIFAFAVGISTGNFGSLSRYKIPCMPFFVALLMLLYSQIKPRLSNRRAVQGVGHVTKVIS